MLEILHAAESWSIKPLQILKKPGKTHHFEKTGSDYNNIALLENSSLLESGWEAILEFTEE